MEKLLKWSLNASNPSEEGGEVKQPDPELLNQLFGGPDDSQLMRESVAVARNPEVDVEVRETALDNLEMLVENLDNANNISNLQLWPDIIALTGESEPAVIRKMACWIIGTAVQNNEKSQKSFAQQPDGVKRLVQLSQSDPDASVRVKALYALSSLIQHHDEGYQQFETHKGWDVLKPSIADDATRVKGLSLLNTTVGSDPCSQRLDLVKQHELVPHVLNIADTSNATAQEKALQFLWSLRNAKYPLSEAELEQILKHRQALLNNEVVSADEYPM